MDIRDFLSPSQVRLDVRAADKAGLLKELANLAAKALNVAANRISTELFKREDLNINTCRQQDLCATELER